MGGGGIVRSLFWVPKGIPQSSHHIMGKQTYVSTRLMIGIERCLRVAGTITGCTGWKRYTSLMHGRRRRCIHWMVTNRCTCCWK
ncbi:unnamed protein product [Cuscuta campestris]|uniref:Uncharacterized protein n=1 Tax=Cuscuta campestris TaxID=132261 RepID=A0A484LUU3_9ASTE|nr:unnamed protein product [Cuscuta campestris]